MGGGSSMNGGHHPVTGAGSPALTSCSWMKMCSWMLSCCLALQHLAVQASLLCVFHLLLLPAVSEEQLHTPSVSVLLARSFFACGISTLLQTSLGSRMPLVQILSFEYLVPALVLSSHLHLGSSADGNGMAVATVCPEPHCTVTESRAALFREVGAPPVLLLLSVPHSPCRISATTLQGIAVSRWGTRRCAEVVGMLVHVAFPGLGASRAGLEHGTGDHLEVSGGDWDAVFSILSPTGLWGRAGLWAHPVGAGSSGCVRLGGAALWAHGPGPQHLYHRAVCLQGGCFLLLCQLGGSTAAHAPHHHLLPAPGVLPSALLCLALCPRSLCGAVRPHLTHSLGSPPLCCCLHGLLYPQPPPPLLGLARPGNSTAFLGQQHPSRTVAPDALCRWGCRAGCSHHPLATSPVPSPLLQMECPEELESTLLTQPWASVCFGESDFIAKACFGDMGYTLLISDLSGVWYESADAEAVGQRSKVCRHLVHPLMRMSLALQHQVQELTSLLLQKDAEIEDYRESGATLSRDRLRTEPFQEETFLQNFMAERLPQICSAEDGHVFTSTLRQLYVAVTLQEAKHARKRHHPEDTEDLAPTAETTGHPDLVPQSPEDETASLSEEATLTSSPVQKPRLPVAKAKPKKAKGLFS
ncbi:uncharacterized protein LOC136057783 isoform X4 [Cyrtonyx montezumae]|uniref:uncharacterized protein LOC136057783 isoform X4 n=1 Tax=Cyrtonyx montezumae TaxID=9017 RepID=UPI0032DB18CE